MNLEREIQNIIDIWIHENKLGDYNKIPKLKEYNFLSKAITQYIIESLPKKKVNYEEIYSDEPFIAAQQGVDIGYNQAIDEMLKALLRYV